MLTNKPGVTENYLYISYRQKQDTPLVTPAEWTSKKASHVPGAKPIYNDLGPAPELPRRFPVNPIPYNDLLVKAPTLPVPRPSRDQQQLELLSLHLPAFHSPSSDDDDDGGDSDGARGVAGAAEAACPETSATGPDAVEAMSGCLARAGGHVCRGGGGCPMQQRRQRVGSATLLLS